METIRTIFKVGSGPSSSHTMGPENAVIKFLEKYPNIKSYKVELYGSLALTGRGHLTDIVIEKTFGDIKGEVSFDFKKEGLLHPNQMKIIGYAQDEEYEYEIASVGGGNIHEIKDGELVKEEFDKNIDVYKHSKLEDIIKYCEEEKINLVEYVKRFEGENIVSFLENIYEVMSDSLTRGLNTTGKIPGELKLGRRANKLYLDYTQGYGDKSELLSAYAYAVNEENASGGTIVTAPTCGASGVVPALLKYYETIYLKPKELIINSLMIAGLIGTITRHNASISGAEAGCQAEIGTATAMAAAAAIYLINPKVELKKINAAAEIALGHQLGLTCDPVLGYVQIPCIQRNAVGANKALLAAKLAKQLLDDEVVDFDAIVEVMYQTGIDLKQEYRETSTGGLAKFYKDKALKNINKGE